MWEKKEGKSVKTPAKIKVTASFLEQGTRRNILPNFLWRRHAGALLDGHQHGGRKPTETSVTEFCYKSANLSLKELTNIKIILFLIHELFR